MSDYLPRLATATLEKAMAAMPVVVLMGARQTGKSTLVRSEPFLEDRPFLTLDDFSVRERATVTPEDFVRSAPRLIIDEVQRVPELLLAVKAAVDEDRPRVRGRFLLTGSANLLLMRKVSETLAGRASYVNLWPMTRRERLGHGRAGLWSELSATPVSEWYDLVQGRDTAAADWRSEAKLGGFPTPAIELESADAREIWFDGYVRTYLERDLQSLASIDNLIDFRRLMRAACHRLGALVNQTELGRDTSIPRPTVQRYLNLLETSYQLVRLEPYSVNRTKRLIKSPKLYWADTGLALHLAGNLEPAGQHLENLLLNDLLAWRDSLIPRPEVLYWRTATNQEVDFVIEQDDHLLPIEVKATTRPSAADARHLIAFRDEYHDRILGALLLHGGEEVFWMSDRVLAAPWWRIL